MAIAIRIALNQRVALQRFLYDSRLALRNNVSELTLRREVLGRCNWVFLGSTSWRRPRKSPRLEASLKVASSQAPSATGEDARLRR